MSLDHRLVGVKARRRKPGPFCGVKSVLLSLGPNDEAMLREWLDDPMVGARGIVDALRDQAGIELGYHTVQRHRRGDCQCERSGAPE